MNENESTLQEFDKLHARYREYYRNGEGARSEAITILYLKPDGTLVHNTYLDSTAHSRAEQKGDRAKVVEVCAFSSVYPDGVYADLRTYAELRRHLKKMLDDLDD